MRKLAVTRANRRLALFGKQIVAYALKHVDYSCRVRRRIKCKLIVTRHRGWSVSHVETCQGSTGAWRSVLKDEEPGERCVHVAVEERRSTQQQQPDLFMTSLSSLTRPHYHAPPVTCHH